MPGRKKRSGAKRGKGLLSSVWGKVKQVASALHQTAKDRKVISGALKSMGHPNLSKMVASAGYGRKKRAPRRRTAGRGGFSVNLPMGGVSIGWGRHRGRGLTENEKVLVI
jgi:hypothetical protein